MPKEKRFEKVIGTNKWRCLKCGKVVKEMGWVGHLRKHKENIHKVNKHIDTY